MSKDAELGIDFIEVLLKHPGYPINNKQGLVMVEWIKSLQYKNKELLDALEMVADADDDARADGNPGMPLCARAKIDAAIAKARGES